VIYRLDESTRRPLNWMHRVLLGDLNAWLRVLP
jgi:hypothetical protein